MKISQQIILLNTNTRLRRIVTFGRFTICWIEQSCFAQQPQWAEVWGGNDKKKILKELSPGAVREKLGKPRFSVNYDFLTEKGMHGTFGAVKTRVVQKTKRERKTGVCHADWGRRLGLRS